METRAGSAGYPTLVTQCSAAQPCAQDGGLWKHFQQLDQDFLNLGAESREQRTGLGVACRLATVSWRLGGSWWSHPLSWHRRSTTVQGQVHLSSWPRAGQSSLQLEETSLQKKHRGPTQNWTCNPLQLQLLRLLAWHTFKKKHLGHAG